MWPLVRLLGRACIHYECDANMRETGISIICMATRQQSTILGGGCSRKVVILGLHIFYSTFLYYMMLEIYVWCDHARLSDIVLIGVLVFCSIYGNRISSIFAFIWHCIEIRSAEINEYMKNAAKHAVTSWVLVNLFVLVYPCPLYDIQRICALFDVGDLLADQTN